MTGKAHGEMCDKHPQLEGLRYLPAWTCVGCTKENSKRLYRERTVEMPKQIVRLTAERDALQALLTAADERADVLTTALTRIHGRAEAFIDDGMHMPTPSIEVIRDIAARAVSITSDAAEP